MAVGTSVTPGSSAELGSTRIVDNAAYGGDPWGQTVAEHIMKQYERYTGGTTVAARDRHASYLAFCSDMVAAIRRTRHTMPLRDIRYKGMLAVRPIWATLLIYNA